MIDHGYLYLWGFIIFAFIGCSTQADVETVINKTIEQHGGEAYQNSHIRFDFRGTEYTAKRTGGNYVYTRTMQDSSGVMVDSLSNTGLSRTVDGNKINLSAQDSAAYANSVNSVIYFAMLPYGLNDTAVNKKLLGQATIKGEPYYEVKVTFDQQDGGTDYEDEFIYWIHRDTYTMDYLAYRFHVDGGGTRFREAYNVRTIKGIRFADYNNYGGADMQQPLKKYDTYFKADTLTKVSEINLEDLEADILDE
jgi:hypothetical protein